ncbi:hypothetical protein [Methanohalophilus portucalensis]|uniref:Uncharacterized protein n=2 Tax=Methanohalophilus portucalensis TaxID=39664 RepID=A0A1L9C2M0_9EURY|nr:hypothetical protein [Methanohalophilus portucalensis]ATU08034.1 hypothetical protein BKM01_04130 [Methanohalophilus portucalensis]OJH48770.1 hypothetical protein MPF_1817 [Methanohalophilus portucalensis FDF-1]RNI12245.1 hypothetical protein EFE41_03820 [Methanohalophilus portucalensis FDF-1]SMH43138.1 hypothetical protein SAMN06264941_1911 [Methanohalophilus portucalensis FDF-1]
MKIQIPKNSNNNENFENNTNAKKKKKLHGKCHERDCIAKQEILKPIINVDMTSKDMYEYSEYKGEYSSFRSHLSRYVKRGYIIKYGKRPSYYQLTPMGKDACIDNPFGYREERIALHNQIVSNYDKRMREKYGNNGVAYLNNGTGNNFSGTPPNNMNTPNDFGNEYDSHGNEKSDDENLESQLMEKDKEIKKLEAEKFSLQMTHQKRIEEYAKKVSELQNKSKEQPNTQKSETQKKNEERINRRKKLAKKYNGEYLDMNFFKKWGNMIPVRVKGKNAVKKGDIEILSKNNEEFSRGHIKHKLNEYHIYACGFAIVNYTPQGIYVRDILENGMKEKKLMKY